MLGDDRISGSAKKTIASILNEALKVEYVFIVNYPRIIDQLVATGRIPDESVVKRLQILGEDSVRHATLVAQSISELDGEPQFDFTVLSKMTNINGFLLDQLEKEKLASSFFQEAESVFIRGGAPSGGKIDARLNRLITDEKRHIVWLQDIISALGIKVEQ